MSFARTGAYLRLATFAIGLAGGLAGCAYQSTGPIDLHYRRFEASLPERDKITVCSGYGCKVKTDFRFTRADIAQVTTLMTLPPKAAGASDERRAVATTLAWMEKRVGDQVGTSADRPGDDFAGVGDPTQMDCVDVATNLTSYLLIMQRHQLLKHHGVGTVFVKEDLRRGLDGWMHFTAVLVEAGTKQQFAVDGWKLASGIPPEIVETEKWYIDDRDILFRTVNTAGAGSR